MQVVLANVCSSHIGHASVATAQAGTMQQRAAKKDGGSGALEVGAVVQVSVDNVDRAKTDNSTATLVVVEVIKVGTKNKEDM